MDHATSRALAAAVFAALLCLAGCKKAQDAEVEAAIERATGAKVDKDGHTVTLKTDKGEIKIASAEDGESVPLPSGFPEDIYMPGKHKVASAMDIAGAQMVNLTTPEAVAEISAGVEQTMQAQGWKREMAMQADGSSTLMYSKDKRHVVYQMVKADDGGTQLAIRTGTDG